MKRVSPFVCATTRADPSVMPQAKSSTSYTIGLMLVRASTTPISSAAAASLSPRISTVKESNPSATRQLYAERPAAFPIVAPLPGAVGTRLIRQDAFEKATGAARYVADLQPPGLAHGKLLLAGVPHARIVRLDVSAARSLPGVLAVLTRDDVPDVRYGPFVRDRRLFATEVVRFEGEVVAAVAALRAETARKACDLIRVEYEPLEAVLDPEAALVGDTVLVHPDWEQYEAGTWIVRCGNDGSFMTQVKGDIEAGLAEADLVVAERYETDMTHAVPIEPHAALAEWQGRRLTVWSSTQAPFGARAGVAQTLGLPESDVRVIVPALGGGFGGKCDFHFEAHAAALARASGRPVRLLLDRREEFTAIDKTRHPMTIELETGARSDGSFTARRARIVLDAGAYVSDSLYATELALMLSVGPYRIPHVAAEAHTVYTNRTPAGSVRAPGGPQMCWAVEQHTDVIAERLGLDPVEVRRRNLVRAGDTGPTGQVFSAPAALECLDRAVARAGWGKELPPDEALGVACSWWFSLPSPSGAYVKLNADGSGTIVTGAQENGSGAVMGLALLAADELGLRPEQFTILCQDTDAGPFDIGSQGSQTTINNGRAVLAAAREVRDQLLALASQELEIAAGDLELSDGTVRSEGGSGALGADREAGRESARRPAAPRPRIGDASAPPRARCFGLCRPRCVLRLRLALVRVSCRSRAGRPGIRRHAGARTRRSARFRPRAQPARRRRPGRGRRRAWPRHRAHGGHALRGWPAAQPPAPGLQAAHHCRRACDRDRVRRQRSGSGHAPRGQGRRGAACDPPGRRRRQRARACIRRACPATPDDARARLGGDAGMTTFGAPETLAEAVAQVRGGAVPVAGGTDLVVAARSGRRELPEALVSLHRVAELRGVRADDDGSLVLGALATHGELECSELARGGWAALADAAALVGSPATRHVGTVGGNLANASPAMELGSPLLVHGASIETTSGRSLAVADFLLGPGRTALEPGELIARVVVPGPAASAYVRLEYRAAMEIAVVGAAALLALDAGWAHPDGARRADRGRADVHPRNRRRGGVARRDTGRFCRRGRARGRADGADLRRARERALPAGADPGRGQARAGARIRAGTPMSYPLELTVNGIAHSLAVNGGRTLLTVLRDDLGLTGAKEGCDDSECGACMVLLGGRPVNSCSFLALQADRREVTTVEGLATAGALDPVQRAFVESGGIQCGYCTPGMLMSATALLAERRSPTADEVRAALAGNLCRCTGYQKIVQAVLVAAAELRGARDG